MNLERKKLLAVSKHDEMTGKLEYFMIVDGKMHSVTVVGVTTTVKVDGFDDVITGSGSIYDVLQAASHELGFKEERVEIPEDKRWRGLMKFSGDTSFSVSANKPNSSWTGGK